MKMKYFLPLLLLIIFSVSTVSADISWTGSNWLFCYNQSLMQYNGTNLTDITPNTVTLITSTGEQKIKARKYFQYDWSVGLCGAWFKHRILSMGIASAGIFNYKDRNFTVWTTGLGVVHGIACNNEF